MNIVKFSKSLQQESPPDGLNLWLLALWYDAKGDWEKAHDLISEKETKDYCLIHAYLHRKEGDEWNADYWYRKAGHKKPELTLEEEWKLLAAVYLTE